MAAESGQHDSCLLLSSTQPRPSSFSLICNYPLCFLSLVIFILPDRIVNNVLYQVPKLSVDRAIRSWPHLLGCSTSKLKLMVEQLGELGVENKKLGQVIAKSPQLLLRKPQEFLQVYLFNPVLYLFSEELLLLYVVLFGSLFFRIPFSSFYYSFNTLIGG